MEWVSINQWRIIRSVLRLKIRFQKFIRVDCETKIFNDKIKQAAITRQIVAVQLDQPAFVELTTLINWPYKLFNGKIAKFPTDKINTVDFTYKDCISTEGQECVQNWRTLLHLKESTCRLDGDYSMNFTLGCGEDVPSNECPIEGQEHTIIEYKLKSEDFCSEMNIDVGIFGVIICFNNDMFDMHKEVFIIGSRVYFLIKINSDINPRNALGQLDVDSYIHENATIKFSALLLKTVIIRIGDLDVIYLWDNFKTCPENLNTNIALVANKGDGSLFLKNQLAFSFTWSRTLLHTLKQNSKLKVTVGAEVEIKYEDSTSKRMFFSSPVNSDKSAFSTTPEVQDDGNGPRDDSSSVAMIVSLFLIIILSLF
jgi:hypothetical protein